MLAFLASCPSIILRFSARKSLEVCPSDHFINISNVAIKIARYWLLYTYANIRNNRKRLVLWLDYNCTFGSRSILFTANHILLFETGHRKASKELRTKCEDIITGYGLLEFRAFLRKVFEIIINSLHQSPQHHTLWLEKTRLSPRCFPVFPRQCGLFVDFQKTGNLHWIWIVQIGAITEKAAKKVLEFWFVFWPISGAHLFGKFAMFKHPGG